PDGQRTLELGELAPTGLPDALARLFADALVEPGGDLPREVCMTELVSRDPLEHVPELAIRRAIRLHAREHGAERLLDAALARVLEGEVLERSAARHLDVDAGHDRSAPLGLPARERGMADLVLRGDAHQAE